MNPPTVEAVVVTYRRPRNLAPVLAALRAQSFALSCVTVIDASPTEDDRPKSGFELADRIMRLGENFGPFNRYVAAFAPRSTYTLFLDDDFTAGPDAVRRMVDVAEKLPDLAVLGQIGRTFPFPLEYLFKDEVCTDGDARRVDLIIRGYLVKTRNLHAIGETLWKLSDAGHPDPTRHDDILLGVALGARGLNSYVYRPRTPGERLIAQELADTGAVSHRPEHQAERLAMIRTAADALTWKPLNTPNA